ncbi:hypothetical protein Alches_12600 [Alicyclobacillus hesperidum subsp. aegles]|uniref:hypothetical protein n=1 Tax=Alicyclobacillus hesperidum TaxID=89784 RepID=UPI00222D583E|nr:hypothetical protein [Alicyclobacillus hesperidum]GLG01221.1 hypothetical protein Alches_12600 [Alicyclobacillus hesperidum subsp. aegles]
MSIKWIHGRYKEDSRVFDSQWEAEEWADSLYPDIVGEGFVNVGYATPDQKVVDFLIRQIPRWAEFLKMHNPSMPAVAVHSSTDVVAGQPRYKVWIEPRND